MDEHGKHRMGKKSREELVRSIHPRYLQGTKAEKGQILNEFVAATGYHRKHALRLLKHGVAEGGRERRGRPRRYTGETVRVLTQVWRICNEICGKRLAPFLPEIVQVLERQGELRLDAATREQLLSMSASTIDRRLAPFKQRKGRSTTKPGTLLKGAIPIRTFADWEDSQPGFLEMDLVAHCGESSAGLYLQTLTATDVSSGWTECLALPQRSQQTVAAAMVQLGQQLPIPLLGVDSDNDSAFINDCLLRYCQEAAITFTRSRPYRKNDQCHVEQKNWTVVRQTIGYQRYESNEALALLGAIYADLRLYTNFFQPVLKLRSKQRHGSRVHKRYDIAQTPFQRLACSAHVSAASGPAVRRAQSRRSQATH
jgi:hypothetical protein